MSQRCFWCDSVQCLCTNYSPDHFYGNIMYEQMPDDTADTRGDTAAPSLEADSAHQVCENCGTDENPCWCSSLRFITSSRTASAETTPAEFPAAPSPAAPSPTSLRSEQPKMAPLSDENNDKMKAFIAAVTVMYSEHKTKDIADVIWDDFKIVAKSQNYSWEYKLDNFNLAMHKCNYLMHVTDDIMNDIEDYTFDYFKASNMRKQVKAVAAKMINNWTTNYNFYLAASAAAQM